MLAPQEVQRLARQHLPVYRLDLVWQRLHPGEVHRQALIEQIGQLDPARLAASRNSRPSASNGRIAPGASTDSSAGMVPGSRTVLLW